MIRVWDRPVRVLHWALAASVALAWATTAWFGSWHRAVGYAALAIVVARLAWATVGSRHAGFAQLAPRPAAVVRYARLAVRGREPRHLGHNPLGACMALAFFFCVGALALTGWLYTTDRFWGDETVERIHLGFAWAIVVLVAGHVVGAIVASLRHRENLIAAMLHGKKRAAANGDID